MVEPINTSQGRPRIARPGEDSSLQAGASGPAMAGGAIGMAAPVKGATGDSVTLSATAQTLPADLKEAGPPMDLEIVKRIKDAIAEGKYPIDLEKITESLFRDYLELMG